MIFFYNIFQFNVEFLQKNKQLKNLILYLYECELIRPIYVLSTAQLLWQELKKYI